MLALGRAAPRPMEKSPDVMEALCSDLPATPKKRAKSSLAMTKPPHAQSPDGRMKPRSTNTKPPKGGTFTAVDEDPESAVDR
jgi:hypothetical protein